MFIYTEIFVMYLVILALIRKLLLYFCYSYEKAVTLTLFSLLAPEDKQAAFLTHHFPVIFKVALNSRLLETPNAALKVPECITVIQCRSADLQ